jgi:hypothetical protein
MDTGSFSSRSNPGRGNVRNLGEQEKGGVDLVGASQLPLEAAYGAKALQGAANVGAGTVNKLAGTSIPKFDPKFLQMGRLGRVASLPLLGLELADMGAKEFDVFGTGEGLYDFTGRNIGEGLYGAFDAATGATKKTEMPMQMSQLLEQFDKIPEANREISREQYIKNLQQRFGFDAPYSGPTVGGAANIEKKKYEMQNVARDVSQDTLAAIEAEAPVQPVMPVRGPAAPAATPGTDDATKRIQDALKGVSGTIGDPERGFRGIVVPEDPSQAVSYRDLTPEQYQAFQERSAAMDQPVFSGQAEEGLVPAIDPETGRTVFADPASAEQMNQFELAQRKEDAAAQQRAIQKLAASDEGFRRIDPMQQASAERERRMRERPDFFATIPSGSAGAGEGQGAGVFSDKQLKTLSKGDRDEYKRLKALQDAGFNPLTGKSRELEEEELEATKRRSQPTPKEDKFKTAQDAAKDRLEMAGIKPGDPEYDALLGQYTDIYYSNLNIFDAPVIPEGDDSDSEKQRKEAYKFILDNPDDPRVPAIREKLGI